MYKDKLNKIKVLLGMEVRLAQAKLQDGATVIESESFEPGFPLFVVTENGPTPAPAGEHVTADGMKITVDEQGTIVSVEEAGSEEPSESEVEITVDAAEEEVVKEEEKVEISAEDEIPPAIEEAMKAVVMAVEEISKDVAEIKTEMASLKQQYAKFSKEPAGAKYPAVTKEAFAGTTAEEALDNKIKFFQTLKGNPMFNSRK